MHDPDAVVTQVDPPRPDAIEATRRLGSVGDDRYRVVEKLGRGGMGEVIAARDEVMGREVAIKRLRTPAPNPHQIERFLREARIQGALDHPAIPPVHELASDTHGQPYFVMQRLVGTTLQEVFVKLARGTPGAAAEFTRERLLRAFAEVCLAVEFAHIRGVIHRDLKPSNIMLGDFGEVYVLDWGVAKVIATPDPELGVLQEVMHAPDVTTDGTVVGTFGYMAPEQAEGYPDLDGRVDVYALGCVLREILAGGVRMPELDAVVAKATAIERERRLATARELGARVQSYLDGDRDLALRRTLGREHLARAREALIADDDRLAMQEAARALALDPTLHGAADLVGRLMLEPPEETPPEVAASISAGREESATKQARLGLLAYASYFSVVPFLFWIGLHSHVYVAVFVAALSANIVVAWTATKRPLDVHRLSMRGTLTILGNAILVALFARMFTPFLIAPGVASVTASIMLASPGFRSRAAIALTIVAMALAILLPWVGELTGVLAPTMQFDPDALKLLPTVVEPNQLAIAIGLSMWAPSLVTITSLLTVKRTREEDKAVERLHVHAWRLRQLVPR